MLNRFLPILTFLIAVTTLSAQIAEPVATSEPAVGLRTPLVCTGAATAGTTTRTLATKAKSNDKHFLCFGDTLFIKGSGSNLSEDPDLTTPAGIAYLFYKCPPTLTGQFWAGAGQAGSDPCISFSSNGVALVSRGDLTGRDTFFNTGGFQNTFNNGKPIKYYYAPVTLYDYWGQNGGGAPTFENATTACININVDNGSKSLPTDTFSVVYLNPVKISNLTLTNTTGSFVISGGLPEYDATTTYTITIALQSNPSVNIATITSGVAQHGSTVTFKTPNDNAPLIITATDGKSCDASVPTIVMKGSDEIVNHNDTACVKITAKGFKNILTWQGSYHYDPSVLQFISIKNVKLPNLSISNFNATPPLPAGSIVFSWDSIPKGATLADGTTLFEMCFKAIGANGTSSTVCMTDSIANTTPLEVSNTNKAILGVNTTCGSVSIGNAMTVQLSNETVFQNDTACVTISAKNFTNIASMSGSFQYDPTKLKFIGLKPLALPGINPQDSNVVYVVGAPNKTVPLGVINLSWFTNAAAGVTLADNVGLFQWCFKAIGPIGTVTPVRFTDTSSLIDIEKIGGIPMGVTKVDGSVTIKALNLSVRVSADSVQCNGTNTGRLRIAPSGDGSPWKYSWQNATTATQNGTGTIVLGDSAVINNLPVGKYYVTTTVAVGNGTKIDTVQIFQPNRLFINAPTFKNPTCANDSDGSLTVTGFGGGVPPYTFKWSTGATTTSITNLTAGSYTCVITDSKGCKDSARASIGVNDISIATKNVTGATCKGVDNGSIVVSGISGGTTATGNYTFRWSNGRTNSGTSSNIANLTPGTYRVTITDLNQCLKQDSFIVTSQRYLDATATIGNIACAGQTNGFLQVIASTRGIVSEPYTFTWWGNPGTPTNTTTSTFLRSLPAGNYPLSIRDNDGCSLDTAFVIVQPDSIKIIPALRNETCRVSGDGQISLTISGGKPFPTNRYSIQWSRGRAGDTTAVLSGLAAGNYTVTISDSTNCTIVKTYTVNKPQPPIIDSISVRNATCSDRSDGAARVFARPPIGGVRLDSFRWSNTGFRDSINNVPPGIYSVTVVTNEGCTAMLTDTITSPTSLAIDAARSTSTNPLCPKDATGSIQLVMKGGTAPYVYNWSAGPTTSNAVFAPLSAGTYSFTISDVNGCTPVVQSVTLVDPPKIDVAFGNIEAISCNGKCNPGDGKATAVASSGTANTGKYNFIWKSGETSNNSNSSTSIQLCGGWQSITVSDGNCAIVDSVEIPQPDAFSFFTPIINQPSCHGDKDGSAEIRVQGGTPPYNYFWSTGANRNTILNVPAGLYSVLITDTKLCSYSYAVNITEPDVVKLDTVAGQTNNVSCFGLTDGQIKVNRTGGNGGITTYTWTPSVSQVDSAIGLKAGSYTVVASDTKGCADSIQYTLTQPDPIYYYMTPPIQPRCNGDLTTLRVDTAFGGAYLYPFSVSIDNGPQYPIGYFIPVFAGTHQISIIEQITGCTLDTSVTITEPPSLLIQFDSLTKPNETTHILVGLGDSIRMLSDPRFFSRSRIVSALPIDSIVWTPKTYLQFVNGDSLRPYVRPLDDITYQLKIFDVNGCSTSQEIYVELDRNRNVFIPNIFSPNGDDQNDYFGPKTWLGVKKISSMRVYDRWGEILFVKENILAGTDPSVYGWDGSFRGKQVETGVYVYLIEVEFEDGQKLLYRGDVTVVR